MFCSDTPCPLIKSLYTANSTSFKTESTSGFTFLVGSGSHDAK